MKLGFQVLPEFVVVQHERDIQILEGLKHFFKCGYIKKNNDTRLCYIVRNTQHLSNIIIPFFEKHSLKTKKKIDFLKFRKVLKLMETKEHLNPDGLKQIEKIVHDMRK